MWKRREIETYLCNAETLEVYVRASTEEESAGPLFFPSEFQHRLAAIRESIQEVEQALATLGKGSPWEHTTKVSDEFLTPLFEKYFKRLKLPNVMAKKNFHELARFVQKDKIDGEVKEKLDAIVRVAKKAVAATRA